MFIERDVTRCDHYDFKYPSPVKGCVQLVKTWKNGYQVIHHYGPEFLENNGIRPMTIKQAYQLYDFSLQELSKMMFPISHLKRLLNERYEKMRSTRSNSLQ